MSTDPAVSAVIKEQSVRKKSVFPTGAEGARFEKAGVADKLGTL